jgi:alkylated DNA repair protein alkB homolog 1
MSCGHDTHALPPLAVLEAYKKYQRMNDSKIVEDLEIVDFRRGLSEAQRAKIVPVATIPSQTIAAAAMAFKSHPRNLDKKPRELLNVPKHCTVYEYRGFNGKFSPSHRSMHDLITR